jgi:hypothetical protein
MEWKGTGNKESEKSSKLPLTTVQTQIIPSLWPKPSSLQPYGHDSGSPTERDLPSAATRSWDSGKLGALQFGGNNRIPKLEP